VRGHGAEGYLRADDAHLSPVADRSEP
jgi:hypothetical protein